MASWHVATGGGLAVLVGRQGGLAGLGSGPGAWISARDADGRRIQPAWARSGSEELELRLLVGPGSWERRGEGASGAASGAGERAVPEAGREAAEEVLERGLVTESGVLVLEVRTGDGQVSRWLGGHAPSDLAPEQALEQLRRRAHPLEARERQRVHRPVAGLRFDAGAEDGGWDSGPRAALAILDEAALGLDGDGRPRGPFVAGVTGLPHGPRPGWLSGSALAEAGLAALLTGRFELAGSLLEALLEEAAAGQEGEPFPAALPLVSFAARSVHWQGQPERLLPALPLLEEAVEQVVDAAPDDAGAAWPSPSGVLGELARALEPVAGPVAKRLEEAARSLRSGPGPSGSAIRLPVLGAQEPARDEAPSRPEAPSLPPLEAFAPVDHGAVLERQTVHAARALRSWLEGVWGLDADAYVGRVKVAPKLPAELLEADGGEWALRGLRVADASLEVTCRGEGGRLTFALLQTGGRVPLQVIFEPHLPFREVGSVRRDVSDGAPETPIDVTVEPHSAAGEAPATSRLRVQFPLDPRRRILVDGTR